MSQVKPSKANYSEMHRIVLSITLFCWYPSIYYCRLILIRPDDSLAIVNCDYYYKCVLELTIQDLAVVAKTPFSFTSPYKNCNVTNWIYCTVPFPEDPADGYCACTGKQSGTENMLHYVFTFFRELMTAKDDLLVVTCSLGTFSSASKQIHMHGFSQTPGPVSTVCEGQNLTFAWDFGFSYDFSQKYRVIEVAWKLGENNLLKCSKRELSHFDCKPGPDIDERTVTWTEQSHNIDQDLPKLIYRNVPKELDNIIVAIAIVFEFKHTNNTPALNPNKVKDKIRRDIVDNELPMDWDTKYSFSEVFTTQFIDFTTTKTTPTTTKKKTTKTSTTTTPAPYDFQVEYKQYIVRDNTKLVILERPSYMMPLDFSGTKTLTGEVIVSCELSKTSRLGNPPVNLTIWHNDKVIITREKTYLLRYMMHVDKGILTCGTVGPSANCFGESWVESQKEVLDIKDINPEHVENTSIDSSLMIYMAESLACLVLMIITTTLVVEHIRAILRRKKRMLDFQMMTLKLAMNAEREAVEEVEAEEEDED